MGRRALPAVRGGGRAPCAHRAMPGPETCDPPRGSPVADADEARSAGDARDTFASILAGCRPLFPRALMGDAGWERLLDRAGRLPRSVADDASFGFEFHLGEPRPEADLFVVVPSGSDLSRHYIREGGRAPEGGRAEPGPAASALAAGLQEQAGNPESYLARSVSCLMLEYDLAGLAPGRPPPPPGGLPGATGLRTRVAGRVRRAFGLWCDNSSTRPGPFLTSSGSPSYWKTQVSGFVSAPKSYMTLSI